MARSIKRVLSPEEQELQRYLDQIERLKSDIATKLADLESYKAELARFSAEYHAVLGPLFAELDWLEMEIATYHRKIELLQSSPESTVEEIEEVVENEFRKQHERIRQDEADNRGYERAWDREQQRPELAENEAAELKKVYRELAKKHHPDFAVDDADRVERENAMKKVNQAFAARDLNSLRNLRDELFDHLSAFERMSIGEKLVWVIREVSRLGGVSRTIDIESVELQQGSLGLLMKKQIDGEPVIPKLKDTLVRRIENRKNDLKGLIDEYSRLRITPPFGLSDE